ncbi:MAG: tetratricopeptide repeat protein [Deltaproteobacteria bacterium]
MKADSDANPSSETLEFLLQKYEKLLADDPSSGVFAALAEVLRRQSKLDRATEILVKGLRQHPENIAARLTLGRIYYDRWMIDAAKREVEMVLKSSPDNLRAARILVEIYRSEGKPDRAYGIASVASLYHPECGEIASALADLTGEAESLRQTPPAPTQSRRAALLSLGEDELDLSPEPSDGEIYTETMADLYIGQGDYERAVEILAAIALAAPENRQLRAKLDSARSCLLSIKSGFEVK